MCCFGKGAWRGVCRNEGSELISGKMNGKGGGFEQCGMMVLERIYTRCLRGIGIERVAGDDADAGCFPGVVWWGDWGVVMSVVMRVRMGGFGHDKI